MGKYDLLYEHLKDSTKPFEIIGFQRIEEIIGRKLPLAAHRYREWWANENGATTSHVQAKAWSSAGWQVNKVDLDGEAVLFRRKT